MQMIFPNKSKCEKNAPSVSCKEKGIRYTAINERKSDIYLYHIDGDILNHQNIQKCDYMIEIENHVYFIELKGCEISHAYEQILSTMMRLSSDISGYTPHARVVCSRISTHDVQGSSYRKLKKKCSDVRYKETSMEEKIS